MTADPARRRNRLLPRAAWPAADEAAFSKGTSRRSGPFRRHGGGRPLSPSTYQMLEGGYGAWLWFLTSKGWLNPAVPAPERITLERLDAYFEHLEACGNADHTILGRFEQLRRAMTLMFPAGDFDFIAKPLDVPIRAMLRMRRRQVFVPDARHNELWADALFRQGLVATTRAERFLLIRDAAIIGVLASRTPRTRAIVAFRLGHELKRTEDGWVMVQEEPIMKERNVSELPIGPRISRILDRYVEMERKETMGTRQHEAMWLTVSGRPLKRRGFQSMIRRRAKAQYGVEFGAHRFRTSLATTHAVLVGDRPLHAAVILCHTPQTTVRHYNRASNIAGSRNHDTGIAEAEEAAWHMVGIGHDPLADFGQGQRHHRRKSRRKDPRQRDLFG